MKAWISFVIGWVVGFPLVATTAFTGERLGRRHHYVHHAALPAVVVDSAMLTDGAVAVASFAAGILTQIPRLQQLEQNATATREEAQRQIAALEARLYALDQEFEQGTAALKEQFDAVRVDQLQKQKRQQAQEFQYKLQAEIQTLSDKYERELQEQRSTLLQEQLELWKGPSVDQQAELVQLRIQQEKWQDRNDELTALLEDAQKEMEEWQRRAKRGFWGGLLGK